MAGGMVFTYKCEQGHKTDKVFPPRTPYDKHSQMLCPECAKENPLLNLQAYIIFAYPEK